MSGSVNRTARGAHVRRLTALTLGLTSAVALVGCSAGQVTQTSSQEAGINGVNVDLGDIRIRNAELAYPGEEMLYRAGADIPLALTIVNEGGTTDELQAISSPQAQGVEIGGSTTLPGDTALRAALPEGSEGATESSVEPLPLPEPEESSPAESSAVESSAGVSSASEPGSNAAAPGDQQDIGSITITITGLDREVLRPGQVLPVTLRFARAGSITMQVPLANPGADVEPPEPEEEPEGEG